MICLTSSNFRANLRALRGFVLATMGLLIWDGCDREPEPSAQQLPSVGSEVDSTALTDEDGHHRMLAELRQCSQLEVRASIPFWATWWLATTAGAWTNWRRLGLPPCHWNQPYSGGRGWAMPNFVWAIWTKGCDT